MPLSPLEYLRHILDEIEYLMDASLGLQKEQFLQDALRENILEILDRQATI